jgi:hypothetical protein
MATSQVLYLTEEIEKLGQFPGMDAYAVQKAVERAGGNVAKLTDLYDKLMEDCYGDDANY